MKYDLIRQIMEEMVPYNRYLGLKIPLITEGHAVLELPFRPEFIGDPTRPALHGGLTAMLADTAGGVAVWSMAHHIETSRVSTIDMRMDYLLPGQPEDLIAEAHVVRVGSKVGVADVIVYHRGKDKKPIATMKGVYNRVTLRHDPSHPMTDKKTTSS